MLAVSVSLVIGASALSPAPVQAAVPSASSVEGVLFSSGGGAAADGTYSIVFGVYKDEVGGNPLWMEGPVLVGVKAGQWQHLLGSKTPLSAGVLNGSTLWLSIQIASDPELPRKPLASSAFAVRAAVADGLECSGCVGAAQIDAKFLAGYAKSADLNKVAFSGLFSDLAGGPDLSAYAKTSALAKVATGGNYSDLNGIPDLTLYAKAADLQNYVKAASLATVAGTGSYNDLKDKPVLVAKGAKCGSGLVMVGVKADGSYECTASAIAADMIDEVSNSLIYNQFIDSQPGTVDNAIPDGSGAGKSDSLDFPDIGLAQAIWVNVNLTNSDVSKVKIELYGPGMATPYTLYNGEKAGTGFSVAFNKDTPLSTGGGDMNKDWVGKNIKGTWSITVKDPVKNQSTANDGKFNWDVSIQTLSSKKIQVKGNMIVDNNVNIGGNLTVTGSINGAGYRPVLRWGIFSTYDQAQGNWNYGNGGTWTLGIAPSTWTDGSAKIWSITTDKSLWRNVLTKSMPIYPTMAVIQDSWYDPSSTNGHVLIVLFRIKNSTGSAINWAPQFLHTNCGSWSEHTSLTLNGAGNWSHGGDCYGNSNCTAQPTLAIPANRVSSVMMAAMSGCGGGMRAQILTFLNGTLALPTGLQYVDDLDTATGDWSQ